MTGSLKPSIMGFATKLLNVYFFETPLIKKEEIWPE